MFKKIMLFPFCLVIGSMLVVPAMGQSGLHYDLSQDLVVDPSGNMYMTGWSEGGGEARKYTTVKFSSAGNFLWMASYDGAGDSIAWNLAVDSSGNVYVAGWSGLVKYDANGVQQWVVGSGYWDVALYTDPNSSQIFVYATGNSDTAKYDVNGTQIWQATRGGRELEVDSQGNLYASSLNGWPYGVIKFNGNGVQQWFVSENYSDCVQVDSSGNVYVGGSSSGGANAFIVRKYNASGGLIWTKTVPFTHAECKALELYEDPIANQVYVYVTGPGYPPGSPAHHINTMKLDESGNVIWLKSYDGPADGFGWGAGLTVDSSGCVYVIGESLGIGTGYSDYVTLKYDAAGNQLWEARYNGSANGTDAPTDIVLAPDASGELRVYVTGRSDGLGTGWDFATVKYSLDGAKLGEYRYDRPCSPDAIIMNLIQTTALIDSKNSQSLIAKLESALNSYRETTGNDYNNAINKLEAFKNACDADKLLTEENRGYLKNQASDAIACMRSKI